MFLDLIKLFLTIPFVFFVPGFFLLLAFFGWKNDRVTFFEKSALAVPLSLVSVDLIAFILNKANIKITGVTIIEAITALGVVATAIFWLRFVRTEKNTEREFSARTGLFSFTSPQTFFIIACLFLAIFIRGAYLSDTIVPSATDLGHHMYWSKLISDSGRLPDYGMPDFIIGEHIPFAAVNLLSGTGFMTAMPALILFLANIAGIFTLAILTARIFGNKKVTAAVFFTAGVLYAIMPPQGKYVSGGVVGNIFGNLLIPVALYFLYRAIVEKDAKFAGLFLFSFLGLLYTHHLSSFILIYSVAAIIFTYLALNADRAVKIIFSWLKIFLQPLPIAVLLLGIVFLLFIYTPTYFNTSAVEQATGSPSKITRVGLNFEQIEANSGSARLILGSLGFLLLLVTFKRKELGYALPLAWLAIIFFMSAKPGWLYVNIPSNRIGNYLFLPLTLLSAFGLVEFFRLFRKSATIFFSTVLLFILMFFVITNGLADSAEEFKTRPQFQEAVQTFHSADYLARTLDTSQDVILKDHVNIYGDSWYKLFFMKDYRYPLSRGNLSRYVDPTKPRETCTRDMISDPASAAGKACFADSRVNYVALNARLEGESFEKYPEFSKVYSSNYIAIYRRN